MRHEQFVEQLLRASAGPRSPSLESLSEGEAVVRWMVWLTMVYVRLEYTPSDGLPPPVPSLLRVWRRWGSGRTEDVDFVLHATGREVRLKARVDFIHDYSFRLSDYARNRWFDATGRARRVGNRLSIVLTRFPDDWPMLTREVPTGIRQPERVRFRPAACCLRALADIQRGVSSLRAARGLLGVGQFQGLFELATSRPSLDVRGAVESENSFRELMDSDWDLWARAMQSFPAVERDMIRRVAGGEFLNHEGDSERERFWELVHETGTVR